MFRYYIKIIKDFKSLHCDYKIICFHYLKETFKRIIQFTCKAIQRLLFVRNPCILQRFRVFQGNLAQIKMCTIDSMTQTVDSSVSENVRMNGGIPTLLARHA